MDKLTFPRECYSLLQEMKSKHPHTESNEKVQEILKLYDKTLEVMESVQVTMQIDNLDEMYGMTQTEIDDKISEVMAEKLQLEDYIMSTDSNTINVLNNTYNIDYMMTSDSNLSLENINVVDILNNDVDYTMSSDLNAYK